MRDVSGMCGIIGYFSKKALSQKRVRAAVDAISARGQDSFGVTDFKKVKHYKRIPARFPQKRGMVHLLHAMVGYCPQPFAGKGFLAANCELYDWRAAAKRHGLRAKNDAEYLFARLDGTPWDLLKETWRGLGQDFAFAYYRKGRVLLARDVFGVLPLFFAFQKGAFAFASEPKALYALGFSRVRELSPRHALVVDTDTLDKRTWTQNPFASIIENQNPFAQNAALLNRLLVRAVARRVPRQKVALLFSGGVDSVVLAKVLLDAGKRPALFFGCVGDPKKSRDLGAARRAARALGLKLHECVLPEEEVPAALGDVVNAVESTDPVKVGVALTFLPCFREMQRRGYRVAFSGLGADELFGGYAKHRAGPGLNADCMHAVLNAYERDLFRDNALSMRHNVELRVPYYDRTLSFFALSIPPAQKIRGDARKRVLRACAKSLGLSGALVSRKKLAAQYGSGAAKAVARAAKRAGFSSQARFLGALSHHQNERVAVLWSTGKDSCRAAHLMDEKNYDLACLVTVASKNPDSFMYHTPAVRLARLHARSMGLPLVYAKTKGDKERELADLERALKRARDVHGANGVVSGALYSEYQRSRIQRICDKLGLKSYTPLWHCDQERAFRAMLRSGMELVLVSVAAQGLDASWLGRSVVPKDVDALVKLKEKWGLNVAGEGGEFESLVLDAPLFQKRVRVQKSRVVESGASARLVVERAALVKK